MRPQLQGFLPSRHTPANVSNLVNLAEKGFEEKLIMEANFLDIL